MSKVKIQIKSVWGSVLYENEKDDYTLVQAIRDANLRGANLGGADLRSVDLYGADLRSVDLRDANLYDANLRGADLRGANLGGADLGGANLRGANLGGADLRDANLGGADLRDANLYGANLYGAKNVSKQFASDLLLLMAQKNRLTAYKYVNKAMQSPVQSINRITYKVGEEFEAKAETNQLIECAAGLNIASLGWCLRDTNGNVDDYIYIEVSFDPKDLVVPYFTDGKFRVNKLKVERKLTKKELNEFKKAIS